MVIIRLTSINSVKLLSVIVVSLVTFCLNTNPAHANNNSFASGTLILTPNGNVPIENICLGDRIIGYNFDNHQQVINTIKTIKKTSLGYYIINNRFKVAGTNFIYLYYH